MIIVSLAALTQSRFTYGCCVPIKLARLESMKAEVGVLHEAMAGLHGEMGAIQRELDSAKTSQDKLTKGEKLGNSQEMHHVDFSRQRMSLPIPSTSRLVHVIYDINGVAIGTASGCVLLL